MSSISENFNYLLPKRNINKKTLVLDLDETLFHIQFDPFDRPSDINLRIEIENEIHDIYVMVRPGVKHFLENMGKIFEIVIFTASLSKYADPLIDIIDEDNICSFRLFREHCTQINEIFVKEMIKLGRDLKDIIIVDNSPMSYCLNPENGLPIKSWFDDKDDRDLFKISGILEFLSFVPDVRNYIYKFVINDEICYKNAMNIFGKYNERAIKIKNNNQIKISENSKKKILKKNNSKIKNNNYIITDNKENISNNITIESNNKIKDKENISNNIIIESKNKSNIIYNIKNRENSKNIKSKGTIGINNIPYNIKSYKRIENKENINLNIPNVKSLINKSNTEFKILNQSTKNRNANNINFDINPIISNTSIPAKSFVNLISNSKKIKHSFTSIFNTGGGVKKINYNMIIRHKKSGSANGFKTFRKIYDNSKNIINHSNTILKHKMKIMNNINKENGKISQSNENMPKNKVHKYSIQLSNKVNNDLIYELDRSETFSKKLSKSLTREKFNILKTDKNNNICNKSTLIKMSKPMDAINKRCHKKSNSINLSYLPLSINIKKEENNSFFKKNSYYQQQYLSTSESYNNYSKNSINNNKLNNSSISTLANIPRHNNSLRKINFVKNKRIIKSNFVKNKIPFNINNKKKYANNENLLKKRIPINNNIIINNNNKSYRYAKIEKNVNYELTDPMTVRQKSSKQITYKKIDKSSYNNNSYKEDVKNRSKINQKYNIGNIINDIKFVNSIIRNNENHKSNKLTN